MSTNRETTGAETASGFQAAPTDTQALSSGGNLRKITSLAGIFCSGSLTTATPKPAATKASALAAPSASLTIRGLNPRADKRLVDWVEKAERSGTDLLPTVEAGKEIRQASHSSHAVPMSCNRFSAQRCDADVRREDLERYAMLHRTVFYFGTCLGSFCKAQSDRQTIAR